MSIEKIAEIKSYLDQLRNAESEALLGLRTTDEDEAAQAERTFFAANAQLCGAVEVLHILGLYAQAC